MNPREENILAIRREIEGHLRRCDREFAVVERGDVDPYAVMCDMIKKGTYYAYMLNRCCSTLYESSAGRRVEFTMDYTMGKVLLRTMLVEAERRAGELCRQLLRPQMSRLFKALVIHNYMLENVTYDMEVYEKKRTANRVRFNYAHSAYGALVKGLSVCQGISDAFKMVMDQAGVPCLIVAGDGKSSPDDDWGGHAWNLLQLEGGRFVHIDATFDIGYQSVDRTRYFAQPAGTMRDDHRWDESLYPSTEATIDFKRAIRMELQSNGSRYAADGVPERYLRL